VNQCGYVYCRLPLGESTEICPRCGHPRDPQQLRDPAFFVARSAALSGLPGTLLDMHQILPAHPDIERYQLLAMDQLGIRRALLQSAPEQATSLCGNAALAEVVSAHPDRFWASQFTDPRFDHALDDLERFARAGHRVVKLLPVAGWRADDPSFDPFWAALQELGLVAMVHTGFFTARHKEEEAAAGTFMSSTFADPLYFDRPCRQFPELPVILCHTGGALWFEHGAQMVTQHDHVWGDVSGFGLFALQRLLQRVSVDWSKLFWGNDSPPFAYPLNLRLLLVTLSEAGAEALTTPLLHDNGQRFADRYLT
jgi:predicted TIM-barrel fold metal-dependent hydrolase